MLPFSSVAILFEAMLTQVSSQVYLLDYGLVYRFNPDGNHKEYKEDPKRKHDGTVEFTSRDAHNGVGKVLIRGSPRKAPTGLLRASVQV